MSFELEQRDHDAQSGSSTSDIDDNSVDQFDQSYYLESFTVNEITLERLGELRRRKEELKQAFIRWIPMRTHTKEQLEELATKLHEHHRNVNISTATGASFGTAGGILTIAGLIAAPFTFGAGLIVTAVGAGIGGVGGLVMAGSKTAEAILSKVGVNAVQQAIGEDTDACIALQQQIHDLERFINDKLMQGLEGGDFEFLLGQLPSLYYKPSSKERVDFGARYFRVIMFAASVTTGAVAAAGAVARGVAAAGTGAVRIAGAAISVAVLPLDIAFLVKSSLELHRGTTSNAVKEIRKILDELECPDENEIEKLLERFIDEKFAEAYNRITGEEEQPRRKR